MSLLLICQEKLPDIFPHAVRPQSPPTSPESAAGSSQSSPKRRPSDQNDLYDQLDRNRRKRSATAAQVLGSFAPDRDEHRPQRPELPSPRGLMRPEDRPQLPPISSYLQSVANDSDVPARDRYPPPPLYQHRERGASSASLQTRLPPIVTKEFGSAVPLARPTPTEPASHTSKGSYSTSHSSLPSPYGSSPPSYPPTMVRPSPTSAPFPPAAERDDRLALPPTSDPSRAHSLGPLAGEQRPFYEAYPQPPGPDRRYSTGFMPGPPPASSAPRAGPPPPQMGAHYGAAPPPPQANGDLPAHYVWEMPVAAINPNGRKRRGNLPKESTSILNDWFCQHISFPYPKEDEKHQLQAMTGLSISQVSLAAVQRGRAWFRRLSLYPSSSSPRIASSKAAAF